METLPDKITATVQEVFSTMIMMEVAPETPTTGDINPLLESVSGLIGLAGTHRGMLAIHLPAQLAKEVTGNFLGMTVESIDDDVRDAIGELANILGGNIKTHLSANGKDIKLSMPTTIYGEEYNYQSHEEGVAMVLPFITTTQTRFLVELTIKKEE